MKGTGGGGGGENVESSAVNKYRSILRHHLLMTKRRLTKLTVTKVRLIRRGRDWPPLFPIQPDSQTLLLSTLSSRINNFRERVHCASKYLDFSLRGKDDPPNYCDLANLSETDAFRFPLRLLAIRSSSSLLHIPSESNKRAKRSPHLDLR